MSCLKEISIQICMLYNSSHAVFDDLGSGINLKTLNITQIFFTCTKNITYNQIIVILLYVHNIYIIIFIMYTPGTNKHTHEKNKIFIKTKNTLTNTNYLQQTQFTSYSD